MTFRAAPRSLLHGWTYPLLAALALLAASPRAASAQGPPRRTCVPDYTATFRVQRDGGAAFVGQVLVTNRTSRRVTRWRLEYEWDRQDRTVRNARVIEHHGQHYAVEGDRWTGSIAPGATVTFGLTGVPGNVAAGPTGYRSAPSRTATGAAASPAGSNSRTSAGRTFPPGRWTSISPARSAPSGTPASWPTAAFTTASAPRPGAVPSRRAAGYRWGSPGAPAASPRRPRDSSSTAAARCGR
jgi:hypothetical protein